MKLGQGAKSYIRNSREFHFCRHHQEVTKMSLKGFESRINVARVAFFDQPRRIIFATGAVQEFVGPEAKRLGGKNVLVVTDKGVKKAGMADTVVDLLKKDGLNVDTYDNLTAEPTAESLRAAVKFAREDKFDV